MFESEAKLTKFMLKEHNKKIKTLYIILMWVGIAGLLSYIAISLLIETSWLDYLLYVSSILFGFGIVITVSLNMAENKQDKLNQLNKYVFYEDYIEITSIEDDTRNLGTVKQYYDKIVKVKETENYLYLYINRVLFLPVIKNSLSEANLTILRGLLEKNINNKKNNS